MAEAAIRERVLDWSPDLVFFQELPGLVPFVETHDLVKATPRSHSGNLAVLLGNHLEEEQIEVVTVPNCAVLVTFVDAELTVANVHLAPSPGGTEERLDQLSQVAAASPTATLAVIGDTNSRASELASVKELGFQAPAPPAPTWDSRRNRFRGGHEFTAYFTRPFTRGALTTDQVVLDAPCEHEHQAFHLSDHFPLLVTIDIGEHAD